MIKYIIISVVGLISAFSLTGCSAKNVSVNKIDDGMKVSSINTSIIKEAGSVTVSNTIEAEQSYKTRECSDKPYYTGYATNSLKIMLGMEMYNFKTNRYETPGGKTQAMFLILSPIVLAVYIPAEILFLQPFHSYSYLNSCDILDESTENIKKANHGFFTGTVKVKNKKTNEMVNRTFSDITLPFSVVLKDENDMFSASKQTINTDNVTVDINGKYLIQGKEHIVNITQTLNN